MNNQFETFYERYDSEEKEVIVLIQRTLGAGYDNGFWDMTVIALGMVFCSTGEIDLREGRLEWPVTEEERNTEKGWTRFERGQICRIKVRKLLDEYMPQHTPQEKFNSWAVIEVLEQAVTCPDLEMVWMKYNKPVIVEDKILGTLVLNRELGMFETTLLWKGNEIPFMLEVNPESKSSWSRARTAARKWIAEQDVWDKTIRKFASQELTSLANEWLADDEEKKDALPITEDTFARRITLSEISITPSGNFSAFYDDDDMFWGHVVEINGSLKKGITSANLAG